MIDTVGSPWLAYAVLVIVTVASRLRCGSWFAPAAFVGLVWSFFTGASLLVVDYPIPGRGLWMLVMLVVAIQLGALIAHELQPQSSPSLRPGKANIFDSLIIPCRRYGLLCTLIAVAGCGYFMVTSLDEFGLPFTTIGILEVGARWRTLRYNEVLEPWSVRLLITWLHPAGLLGGILFACSRKRLDRLIASVSLLPAIFYGILVGARAAILLGLTCWIGGYVSTLCVRNRGRMGVFSAKRIALLLLAAASMVGMFVFIDAAKDTSWNQGFELNPNEQRINDYMFGSSAAFADWYAHANLSDAEWGAETFAGEFDLLHLKTRITGKYLETSNVVGTEVTNVYTLFRGLIEDFTEIGAMLVAAAIGGLAGWIYRPRFKNLFGALFWLSAFYAAFLFSPLVSLFSFNGAMLAWVVGWFVLVRANPQPLAFRLPRTTCQEAAP
ncbi:MAG TPA: O-antigen polymerase [Candidatus Sulfotelmatobacter sp.]